MLNNSDPWQIGIRMVTRFFGFDLDEQPPQNDQRVKPTTHISGIKQAIEESIFGRPQPKGFHLKQKWRKLMRFPSHTKHQQIIQLLKEGSAIQDETWVWMMSNSQKISTQLYSSKKQMFHRIIYSSNNRMLLLGNGMPGVRNVQVEDLEQNVQVDGLNSNNLVKKRKFSITRDNLFGKQHPLSSGRLSISNDYASTYSGQTQHVNNLNKLAVIDSQKSLAKQTLLCGRVNHHQCDPRTSCIQLGQLQSSPDRFQCLQQQWRIPHQQNLIVDQSIESQLVMLPQKINHTILTSIIGAFLLHRQDFSYSVTLFNMTATFYYYTNSNQIKTYILLNHVACSQFFVHYLTRNTEESNRMIAYITNKIRENCSASAYLRSFKLQNFIQKWFYGFFYSICENGNEIKQKIIGYLLINSFSLDSLLRFCQSLILSLNKTISQGNQQKIYECLQNPKYYIDTDVLFHYLLLIQQ